MSRSAAVCFVDLAILKTSLSHGSHVQLVKLFSMQCKFALSPKLAVVEIMLSMHTFV